MGIKKLAVAGLLGIASLGWQPAHADVVEKLVKILQEKNLITPQEAQQLLQEAKKEREQNQLPENTLKRLEKLAQIKISGKAYLHYDYTRTSPDINQDDKGEFKVTRAYFEVRKYFNSKDNYFRITTDVRQDNDGYYRVFLKYAYLNWTFSPLVATEIGMVHRAWVDWEEHHGWLHRDVEKTFIEDADGAHLIGSADLGIALKGKYGKLFDYLVGIYNGEGYHGLEDDKHFGKSIEGRISFYPYQGVTLAFHTAQIFNSGTETNKHIYQPFVEYKNQYFLIAAQYIYDHEEGNGNPTYNNYGWSINGDVYLKPVINMPITLFGRYGSWNFDSDLEGDKTDINTVDRWQVLIGGAYKWNKYIRTSLAYKYVKYDLADSVVGDGPQYKYHSDYKDTIMAVMQVKW
jgi:hypothetical protein